jgi:hypothetical protein
VSNLLVGLRKPPLQNLRHWSMEHMERQGAGVIGHCKAGPGMASINQCERASKCSMSWKESNLARSIHGLKTTEGGNCQDMEKKETE